MALTLTEAGKLSNDVLLQGVIETVIKDSPVLQTLPFIEIVGNGLTYNREKAAPTVGFYAVGDTWAESTPTFSQLTATLSIMGGDADVDNYLATTRSNIQDLEAAVVQLKARAIQHKFEDTFINGDSDTDSDAFDGVNILATGDQALAMGANGGSLTLDKLDELVDAVKGGKPDMILMSRRSRRKLNALARTSGSGVVVSDRDEFGQMVQYYDGIAIGVNDWISDAQTVGTSADCSSVFAYQAGEGSLVGLTSPGGLQVEPVGNLETKDARRTRVKWYVSLALFNTAKLAKLTGVRN